MPKIHPDACPSFEASGYPPPFDKACRGGQVYRIGAGAGLTDYGATLTVLAPGTWSSQRHWHDADDELMVMIAGEVTLVEEGTRTPMRPGDIAAFPKNVPNGHHLVNESEVDARFLVVGANRGGTTYPDIDLLQRPGESSYRHKDGTPY